MAVSTIKTPFFKSVQKKKIKGIKNNYSNIVVNDTLFSSVTLMLFFITKISITNNNVTHKNFKVHQTHVLSSFFKSFIQRLSALVAQTLMVKNPLEITFKNKSV